MKSVRPVIASNGVSYLQMISVGSHSTPEREKEGKDEASMFYVHNYIFAYTDLRMKYHR